MTSGHRLEPPMPSTTTWRTPSCFALRTSSPIAASSLGDVSVEYDDELIARVAEPGAVVRVEELIDECVDHAVALADYLE